MKKILYAGTKRQGLNVSRKEVKRMAKNTKKSSHAHTHFHIIIAILSILVVIFAVAFFNIRSSAADVTRLDYQQQIANKQCNTVGNPVINVTQRILNDADSGEAGNYWGFDTISRHIQVFKQTNRTYCGLVEYEGTFLGQSGQRSPGNTGTLTGSESGSFHGGYRLVISGTIKPTAGFPAKGSLGTTDYQCDLTGNCPGAFTWYEKYFDTEASGFSADMVWWGWTYRNGSHVWVNAISGNSGDII